MKTCEQCDKEIHKDRRFCSNSCHNLSKPVVEKQRSECPKCQTVFEHYKCMPRKFCSRECAKKAQIGKRPFSAARQKARESQDPVYIVYKTTNLITGEYYVGVHINTNVDYYGSGKRLVRSIKKYGKHNFARSTLFDGLTESAAFEKEKEVLKEHLGAEKCLNLASGGSGGPNFRGKKHSEATKAAIKDKVKARALSLGKDRKNGICVGCGAEYFMSHRTRKYCGIDCFKKTYGM